MVAGCARSSGEPQDPVPLEDHVSSPLDNRTASPDAPGAGHLQATVPAPNQVIIDNFTFKPPRLTVASGTKVTWVNRDDVPHTVTSSVQPRVFHSGTLDTDQQFSHVFTTPGTYDYFCAVHPHMTAQVIVR
ncbi:MAG: cupredoxin family copper-binding protein [Planctomycetes bacterium]|nr:cupredoxin family copper-binding protein [Planctomycetota bacterium]